MINCKSPNDSSDFLKSSLLSPSRAKRQSCLEPFTVSRHSLIASANKLCFFPPLLFTCIHKLVPLWSGCTSSSPESMGAFMKLEPKREQMVKTEPLDTRDVFLLIKLIYFMRLSILICCHNPVVLHVSHSVETTRDAEWRVQLYVRTIRQQPSLREDINSKQINLRIISMIIKASHQCEIIFLTAFWQVSFFFLLFSLCFGLYSTDIWNTFIIHPPPRLKYCTSSLKKKKRLN